MTAAFSGNRVVETSIVAAQYEVLRCAALGQMLPPEARSGLALFLRRGMWGWARVLAAAQVQQPIRSSCRSMTGGEHRAVIHLFAAMAIHSNDRRAR